MFCAADHPFLHLEKHQQTSPAVPLHECKKIIIGSAPVNLVISAENEGLSNAGQIVFTYSSRACVHRISVLLDLLAVKVKLFHWRWTSRDTWCGTNCWSGRASSVADPGGGIGGQFPPSRSKIIKIYGIIIGSHSCNATLDSTSRLALQKLSLACV